MEETPPITEKRRGPQHKREIAWGILLPAASLGVSLAIWVGNLHLGALDELSHHASSIASFERYIIEHTRDADKRISQIDRNTDRCQECCVEITEIKADIRAIEKYIK